jgi:metal-responsive CopG/Arc/MetJ family transcriptional regulator
MSALTFRLPHQVIDEVDNRAKKLHITRSEYIRKSIESMNKKLQQQERKDRFFRVSNLVRKESMIINSEFSKVEHEPKD